jgi:CBS domain containing-hemolysin-like protein
VKKRPPEDLAIKDGVQEIMQVTYPTYWVPWLLFDVVFAFKTAADFLSGMFDGWLDGIK